MSSKANLKRSPLLNVLLYLSSKVYTALNARTIVRCNRMLHIRRLKKNFSPACRRLFDLFVYN